MNPEILIALPLLAAFLLPAARRIDASVGIWWGPLVVLANLVIAAMAWWKVQLIGPQSIALGGFAAPLGIELRADHLGLSAAVLLNLAVLLLWPRETPDKARVSTILLVLTGAGCGLAMSADLFNLYVFFELVAVATYGLAAANGKGEALIASLRYLILGALGSALALLGIALVYAKTGTLNLTELGGMSEALSGPAGIGALVLMVVGFGVKAELFPLNNWVPEVYAHTESRVSALMAGIISKLGILVLLRLIAEVFGGSPGLEFLLWVGVLGVVTGELAAYGAKDMRRVLAYSSIGQMGLVAVALALGGETGFIAALILMLNHLLVKPALFLIADAWPGSLKALAGKGRARPLGAVLFVLLALSLIGVPPLPGFWGKYLLLDAIFTNVTEGAGLLVGLILAATVVEAAYFFRIAARLFGSGEAAEESKIPGLPAVAALFVIAFLALSVQTGRVGDYLKEVVHGLQPQELRMAQSDFPDPAASVNGKGERL